MAIGSVLCSTLPTDKGDLGVAKRHAFGLTGSQLPVEFSVIKIAVERSSTAHRLSTREAAPA